MAERNAGDDAEAQAKRNAEKNKNVPSPERLAEIKAASEARLSEQKARAPVLLDAIANETGGRHFSINAEDSSDIVRKQLNEIFFQISTELRGQYSIGFYLTPGAKATGRLRVQTINPAYHVRTRQ